MSKQAVKDETKADDGKPDGTKPNGTKPDGTKPDGTKQDGGIGDVPSKEKPKPQDPSKKIYVDNKNITLTEDVFGTIQNAKGCKEKVYRYTWSNHNKIEIEVITYGARIRSIKMPNKKGIVDDIALGFKDLAGYVYYDSYPFGATLGRVTSYIENGTFVIDGKQYWVSSNEGKHHYNGGNLGFDGVIFTPYVDGTKVILSHNSPDLNEGFPGNLMVRIAFELTPKNEFTINMEALTTKPTLVNLSNLLYFNLAGHQSGPEEIYKHTVTINSNCYTIYDENKLPDKLPTGDIQNVVNTQFDFQIPLILKSCMGVIPDDGFDQNLCVNKGIEQGLCFVARALHVPTGRILEVYSNQWGVNFSTGNDFGSGLQKPPPIPSKSSVCESESEDDVFKLLDEIYNIMLTSEEEIDEEGNRSGDDEEKLIDLVERLSRCKYRTEEIASKNVFRLDSNAGEMNYEAADFSVEHMTTALELNYLNAIKEIAQKAVGNASGMDLQTAVYQILDIAQNLDRDSNIIGNNQNKNGSKTGSQNPQNLQNPSKSSSKNISKNGGSQVKFNASKNSSKISSKEVLQNFSNLMNGTVNTDKRGANDSILLPKRKPKGIIIPSVYKDGRIHGKNNAIYKRHGGIAFRTQNYPNAIYHTNFPNSILRPGETYQHTIVYKFYVQGGNPGKWIKRCC